MVLKIAKRSNISPFIVMDVMRAANERAAAGKDVLHLEVGQPSTSAPLAVIEAAKIALDDNLLGYTDSLGIPALRRCLSDYYESNYNFKVPEERIVITTGSSAAFVLSFLAVFEVGDKVGILIPGYPAYKNILQSLGIEVIEIPVNADTAFQLSIETLENLDITLDGLIIASPSNPTGTMLSNSQLREICVWCNNKGVRLISDEIYHGITYQEKANTALCYSDNVLVINSFSKYFSMTGWRLGWVIVPENLIRVIERLSQNFFISPPTLSQLAAVLVFDCLDDLNANVKRYAKNREILLNELPKMGFKKFAPSNGAFYIYADVTSFTQDSEVFCGELLSGSGVAITPGIDFDSQNGRNFVRFSYAGTTPDIAEASHRLQKFLC